MLMWDRVMRGEKVTQGESVEEKGREPGMALTERHRGKAEQEQQPGEQPERLERRQEVLEPLRSRKVGMAILRR